MFGRIPRLQWEGMVVIAPNSGQYTPNERPVFGNRPHVGIITRCVLRPSELRTVPVRRVAV